MRGAPDSHASHVHERGARESGRGRRRERACVPVPLSSGEREEGAHAHFSSKKAALNYAPSVAILLLFSRQLPYPVRGDIFAASRGGGAGF